MQLKTVKLLEMCSMPVGTLFCPKSELRDGDVTGFSMLTAAYPENRDFRYAGILNEAIHDTRWAMFDDDDEFLVLVLDDDRFNGDDSLYDITDEETISDGFGSTWSKTCPRCKGRTMDVVRPGEVQCVNCG
jgi:hypothetical protein